MPSSSLERTPTLIAVIVYISALITLCDARSLLETLRLKNGLKLSVYTTEADALDIPTIDAYNNLDSASSMPFPPLDNAYGSSSSSSSLAPSPDNLPISTPRESALSPSPYGPPSQISDPPANQPTSAHIEPIGPQFGTSQPKKASHSLRPAAAPGPKGFGPDYALWCVARPTVPETMLQRAMDYACGTGANCSPIRPNGPCFVPNTLVAHASYAFNSYWQRTKILGGTCDFGGTAMLITVDPSFSGCHFVYN